MSTSQPDWDDIRFFLSVARTQSLTGSAALLNVSQSTVSRRIKNLETCLQARLFIHHQSGYSLSDTGLSLLRYAEKTEESILQLENHLSGTDRRPEGTVRLATSELLSSHLIIPALPAFRERYPLIHLEIITGITAVSMSRHDADLALRMVRPQQNSLKIRRAGHIHWSVYGSSAYLHDYPAPQHWQFICWDSAFDHLPAARWLREQYPDAGTALVTTSLNSQIAAAQAGLGLAVLPDFAAARTTGLYPASIAQQVFAEDIWMVSHTAELESARVRAVADFLLSLIPADKTQNNPRRMQVSRDSSGRQSE